MYCVCTTKKMYKLIYCMNILSFTTCVFIQKKKKKKNFWHCQTRTAFNFNSSYTILNRKCVIYCTSNVSDVSSSEKRMKHQFIISHFHSATAYFTVSLEATSQSTLVRPINHSIISEYGVVLTWEALSTCVCPLLFLSKLKSRLF